MSKVLVKRPGSDKAAVFEGDFDVALSPDAVLVVNELIPDVGNDNNGTPLVKTRALFNPNAWEIASLED